MSYIQPERVWVIMRHVPTGAVWHAGWAWTSKEGYRFEEMVLRPPHPLDEYRNERVPSRQVGRIH